MMGFLALRCALIHAFLQRAAEKHFWGGGRLQDVVWVSDPVFFLFSQEAAQMQVHQQPHPHTLPQVPPQLSSTQSLLLLPRPNYCLPGDVNEDRRDQRSSPEGWLLFLSFLSLYKENNEKWWKYVPVRDVHVSSVDILISIQTRQKVKVKVVQQYFCPGWRGPIHPSIHPSQDKVPFDGQHQLLSIKLLTFMLHVTVFAPHILNFSRLSLHWSVKDVVSIATDSHKLFVWYVTKVCAKMFYVLSYKSPAATMTPPDVTVFLPSTVYVTLSLKENSAIFQNEGIF